MLSCFIPHRSSRAQRGPLSAVPSPFAEVMGVLTVLLTILGGSQEREVSLPYPSVALIAQEARTLFPELGSAPLTMQATWWGKEQKPFRLTANNVGLLRNTTTVTVSRNDGGKDAYAAVRAIDHLERD